MNLTRETVPDRFDAVEAACVSDDELTRIEGGIFVGCTLPLVIVKIINDLIRTPPTVPVRTPPSPG